jgi:hypothetical protein
MDQLDVKQLQHNEGMGLSTGNLYFFTGEQP